MEYIHSFIFAYLLIRAQVGGRSLGSIAANLLLQYCRWKSSSDGSRAAEGRRALRQPSWAPVSNSKTAAKSLPSNLAVLWCSTWYTLKLASSKLAHHTASVSNIPSPRSIKRKKQCLMQWGKIKLQIESWAMKRLQTFDSAYTIWN